MIEKMIKHTKLAQRIGVCWLLGVVLIKFVRIGVRLVQRYFNRGEDFFKDVTRAFITLCLADKLLPRML